MKRFILGILIICSMCAWAESPKREFRATWLAAVGVDWPNQKIGTPGDATQIAAQKAELVGYLDDLVAGNMNAICYHVRPMADAFYKSNIDLVPWSHYLMGWGMRGKNPGYDPLAYAIEEAHARGLELHAWINPFRYRAQGLPESFYTNDKIANNHPDWILDYTAKEKGTILDPANPDVRAHIVAVVKDIIDNYDVDGIIFDDYFYPYGGTNNEDAASQAKWNTTGMNVHDWRRENIDKLIKAVYDMIAASSKPWVRFGISPFGIWTTDASAATKYGVTLPSGITGANTYKDLGCNTLSWMQGGYVDYISPQLYWATNNTDGQAYATLAKWWSDMAETFTNRLEGNKKVHFFSSQSSANHGTGEIGLQIDYNRQYDKLDAPGSIFFSHKNYVSKDFETYLTTNKFTQLSLPPAMDWKSTETLAAPTNVTLNGSTLSWSHAKADRFTVYAYAKGTDKTAALASSSNLVGVVYGNSIDLSNVNGYASKTLAVCAYDRYGKEWEAALYNAETSGTDNPDPDPDPTTPDATYGSVKFYYQGGRLDVPADNNALWNKMWEEFKVKYPSLDYNSASFVTPVMTDLSLGASETSIGRFLKNNFVDNANQLNATANDYTLWTTGTGIWKWLGDYFQVYISSIFTGSDYSKALNLSFETQGFLQQKAALGYGNYPKGDWTEKGEPASWQPTYIFTHQPTKEGDTFVGWFDNAKGNGSALTTLPASGDVYACWKSNVATDVESIENATAVYLTPTFNGVEIFFTGTQSVAIYNMNGMQVAGSVSTDYYACDLQTGVYIIRVGHTIHKFIR